MCSLGNSVRAQIFAVTESHPLALKVPFGKDPVKYLSYVRTWTNVRNKNEASPTHRFRAELKKTTVYVRFAPRGTVSDARTMKQFCADCLKNKIPEGALTTLGHSHYVNDGRFHARVYLGPSGFIEEVIDAYEEIGLDGFRDATKEELRG